MPEKHIASASRISLLALALCGSASMIYYHLGVFVPRVLEVRAQRGLGHGYSWGGDFYPIWLTTRESCLRNGRLYGPDMTRSIQTGLFGRALDPNNPLDPPPDYRQFAYPAFTDLLLWPAALLQFSSVRLFLSIILPLITVISLWFWVRALHWEIDGFWFALIVLLTLSSYFMMEAFFATQPGLIVGFCLAATALGLRSNRFVLAGSLASFALIKPQVSLLAVIYLLLWSLADKRRARFWQAFSMVTALSIVASLAVWPHWISEWVYILLGYQRYAMPPLIQVLLGRSVPAYIGKGVGLSLIGLGTLLAWRNRRATADSSAFWFTLSMMLTITSVALLPGQAVYDDVILVPGIFLIVLHRHGLLSAGWISRTLLYLGGALVFWPWITAPLVLALRPWVPASLYYSPALFALPIRSAVPLPFAVLALLWWTWRVSREKTATA